MIRAFQRLIGQLTNRHRSGADRETDLKFPDSSPAQHAPGDPVGAAIMACAQNLEEHSAAMPTPDERSAQVAAANELRSRHMNYDIDEHNSSKTSR